LKEKFNFSKTGLSSQNKKLLRLH